MEIKEYVTLRKAELASQVAQVKRPPSLAIIQVNHDPASEAYVRGKKRDLDEIGMVYRHLLLDEKTSQADLLALIKKLNHDETIDGLLVQMPLPSHIDPRLVERAIDPRKDVDGFHPCSSFTPCTPKGIIEYLTAQGAKWTGLNAVVIGRSHIVGRPLARLLCDLNTNCVILHSKTRYEDKARYLKDADLIFTAVGLKDSLTHEFVYRPDAMIVDIGINRVEGKLYGDCEPDLPVRLQTPVPGGVGLLTRLALLENVMEAYQNGIQH